ncbi:helix-turn-helix domain-containing protein [Leptospira adleri]|uniref:HTH araC/xylS-type domain-containing protein n=1 Tax=Leptospira adleri TaxID=2023186 RepID=A0A2M9YMM5_9LEPT|nr:helix-turn-helix domain-containing protein [Leptospira adleri]PJZ52791.1 hypothetical protein CH380_13680 [Leptospira adleri]PJZ60325.1 hypothetical protein CH376_19070 [Leptospira adleri]
MSYDFYFACSIQYIAFGLIYFFKRRRPFHRKQALILIFIGFNLILFSTQDYISDKTLRILGDFLYSFFMISGSIIIYTICKESFDPKDKERVVDKGRASFAKEISNIGLISFFASAVIVIFWNHSENHTLPNLFVSVSEVSILILIFYCIYVQFFIKSFYVKKGLRLIYFLITLMLVEKMKQLTPGNFQQPAMKIGGIVYIVSPIFLFNTFIRFPFKKEESKKQTVLQIPSKSIPLDTGGNYYLNNMDTEKIKRNLHHLLHNERIFLDEDLRLPSVAEELGLTTHQLSAFLNRHLQTNFNTLVNIFRVKEAMKLLEEESSRSIISIGMAVGFNSLSTFQRAFMNLVRMTPTCYRENVLSGNKIELPSYLIEPLLEGSTAV